MRPRSRTAECAIPRWAPPPARRTWGRSWTRAPATPPPAAATPWPWISRPASSSPAPPSTIPTGPGCCRWRGCWSASTSPSRSLEQPMRRITLLLAPSALLLAACVQQASEQIGLAPAQPGTGPMMKWNMQAKPLPDIPFPNDIATWPDPGSPTGLRVNASLIAPTDVEAAARQNIDALDGFGIYAPITVEFSQQINLDDLYARQTADDNFADDAIFLINMNPGSPRYGKPVILDMGHGNFPVILQDTS